MFVLLRSTASGIAQRIPGESLFLRPTPWKVAWEAGFDYLRGAHHFYFVYLPHNMADPTFEYRTEHQDLVIYRNQSELARLPLLRLTFWLWVFYGIESFAYGFFQRFWAWRWDGKPSRQELERRIEELEARVNELLERDS